MEYAVKIDLQQALPFYWIHLLETLTADNVAVVPHTRVVDHDVDFPKVGKDGGNRIENGLAREDVHRIGPNVSTGGFKIGNALLDNFRIDVAGGDAHSISGKLTADRKADIPACTRYNRYTILKTAYIVLHVSVPFFYL
jgi:hypothetical protein